MTKLCELFELRSVTEFSSVKWGCYGRLCVPLEAELVPGTSGCACTSASSPGSLPAITTNAICVSEDFLHTLFSA